VQAAVGAPYAHTTAPIRRLVDRWVLVVCEALAGDRPVPDWVRESLVDVPAHMERSAQLASRLEAASVNIVEAAVLHGHEGEDFHGVVLRTREHRARVQLTDPPVSVNVDGVTAAAGSTVRLKLVAADIAAGTVTFAPG
jgi:exoribonuclease R